MDTNSPDISGSGNRRVVILAGRGPVFLQSIITTPVPNGNAWNMLSDVPVRNLINATRMILNVNAVTEVRLTVGERRVRIAGRETVLRFDQTEAVFQPVKVIVQSH